MKRVVSLLIIFSMLLSTFPPMELMERSYAASYQVKEWNYPGFNKLNEYQKSLIDQLFIQNIPLQNKKGMYIAIKPLASQHVTVYNWDHLGSKGFGQEGADANGEFRYIGYDLNGNKVTNDKYTNGPVVGDRNVYDLPSYTYFTQNNAKDTWARVKDTTTTTTHMLQKEFISEDEFHDTNPKHWTMKNLLSKTVTGTRIDDPNNANGIPNDSLKPYLIMQTPASLNEKGSMRAYGRGKGANGQLVTAYNTFNVEPIDKTFKHAFGIKVYEDKACTKAKDKVEFAPSQETISVFVKLNSDISLDKLNLKGQEAKYFEYVEHIIKTDAEAKGNKKNETNLADPRNVNTVYEVVLKKKDYSTKPKTLTFFGRSTPKIRYALLNNITAEASTNLQVTVANPSIIAPDFTIHYGGEDKTDDNIKHDQTSYDKNFVFDLKDKSYVPEGNQIDKWNWFAYNYETETYDDYFGWTKDTTYTLTTEKTAKYIKDSKIRIKQRVVDKYGKTYEVEHTVGILLKGKTPDPVVEPIVYPKAFVYAPRSIRAGQKCTINGEGSSGNGEIISYDFDYAYDFKVTKTYDQTRVEGAFLRFDSSPADDWIETTYLKVTDVAGRQSPEASEQTKVKHPIEAVFKTNGVYKVHRTIELDSTASTGTTYYPIDKVTWTIRPMDGQSINVVKPHVPSKTTGNTMTIEGAKPKVDFKQLGRYEVWMDVHSTCTLEGETHRTASKQIYGIINIAPDEAPIAKLSVPRVAIRDYDDAKQANITLWDESYSPDGDIIGKRKFYARRDTDNDKKTDDETWELVYEGINSNVDYKTPYVGFYEFKVEVEEANDSNTSPFWNAATDTLRANSDQQPLIEKQTEVLNVAPITSIMAERKKLDLVLVTDYEGSDYTALKAELDLLTKDLFEKGVDIEVQVFKDKQPNGKVKVPVYTYTRTMRLSYVSDSQVNNNYMNNHTFYQNQIWETRYQTESEFLPNYGPQTVTFEKNSYDSGNSDYGIIDYGIQLDLLAPYDPAKKNGRFRITETRVVPQNGIVEYHNNHRNFNVTLDGHYTRGAIKEYQEQDLYCMDLSKLQQAVKYREGSDRQMVFLLKSGDSVSTLNQAFADYIKQNSVVVSAINGFDMTSQYGGIAVQEVEWLEKSPSERGPQTVNDYDQYGNKYWVYNYENAILKGLNIRLENGKDYALLNPYAFQQWGGMQYNPVPDYPVVNANYSPVKNGKISDEYEVYTKTYEVQRKSSAYASERKDWTAMIGDNDKTASVGSKPVRVRDPDTGKWYYDTVEAPGERLLIKHMAGCNHSDGNFYFVKNNNLYAFDYRAHNYNVELPWTMAKLIETDVREVPTGELFNRSLKWGGITAEMANHLLVYYPKQNKTRVMGLRGNGGPTIDLWLNGKVVMLCQKFLLTDAGALCLMQENFDLNNGGMNFVHVSNEIQEQINYRYFLTFSGDVVIMEHAILRISHLTQGLNAKKMLTMTDCKSNMFRLVFLTNDGKLLGLPRAISENIFVDIYFDTSKLPITADKFVNLVKDPRTLAQPVVNALSMRKLLNQSSANRISGSFSEFGNRLRADYEYLKYQTKVTVLLGETLKYDQLYYDREGDPLAESAMAIQHDPNALESPLGTDVHHNKTLSNWDAKLTKTGLYKIQPKVKDKPSFDERFSDYSLWNKDDTTIEVLVHRKPIASMKLSMTQTAPFIVTAKDSNSRDLDHISMAAPLRGITEVEWGIKKLYADEWEISKGALNTGVTKTLETGETYIVSYRVKDVEGQWSDPVTEQIVAGMNLLLDGKLKPENPSHNLSKFQTGNNVVFHELWTSYPLAHHLEIQMYDGNTPIFGKVTLRKEWGQVRAENYPERDWHDAVFNIPRTINGIPLADKTYNFVVTAFDSSNPSIKKQKQFQVTTVSNSAPTVSFTLLEPQTFYEGDLVDVKLKVDDPDKDLLNLQVYMRYDNQPEKLLETHMGVVAGTTIGLKRFELPKAKNLELRAVVTDPLGATGEAKTERPIQALGIEQVALKGAWNHWRGQTNAFGQQMTNEPYRFLGYEKISMTVTTRGEPEQLSLKLEAPLEAMQYVDAKGRTYTYKEEIGADVQFPIIFRKIDSNKYHLEYILPIADSTITWEGQRKRPPYQLYVTLKKDGRVRTVIFGDAPGEVCIDMTGNIFDLVFNQPARPKR